MFYPTIFPGTLRNTAAETTAMSAQQEARNAENATELLKFDDAATDDYRGVVDVHQATARVQR